MSTVGRELFYQGTNQLTFLLLAQRNIILADVFAVALATFIKKFDKHYLRLLSIMLLSYSIAVGVKSYQDFNDYMNTVQNETTLNPDEENLINKWKEWVYFTYFLIAFTSLLLLMMFFLEFKVLDFISTGGF